jgi:prepilin peptidase CpaA
VYGLITGAVFLTLLVVGCVRDAQVRRIPNKLVLLMAVLGLVASIGAFGAHGVTRSLSGLATGFAIWIPFYALRMMGAGDVKFFAAAAAWLSPIQAVDAALVAAFAGGVLSLLWMVKQLGPQLTALRLLHAARFRGMGMHEDRAARGAAAQMGNARRVPYGIAMAVGLALELSGVTLIRL